MGAGADDQPQHDAAPDAPPRPFLPFFRVGGAFKDTVIVPPHMGQITFDFVADNPGDWLFHCHNLYHLEAGMARLIRYV